MVKWSIFWIGIAVSSVAGPGFGGKAPGREWHDGALLGRGCRARSSPARSTFHRAQQQARAGCHWRDCCIYVFSAAAMPVLAARAAGGRANSPGGLLAPLMQPVEAAAAPAGSARGPDSSPAHARPTPPKRF